MAENVNISPEMINNLVSMLKNNSNTNGNTENKVSDEANSSNVEESRGVFSDFASAFGANSNSNSNNSNNIDFDTIMKIKTIMEALNSKNDAKSNLLYSLKPYLRKSKQAKLDQYVNLLKISQVSNLFKNEKGDVK